jgi:hypothetical protein
VKDKKLQAAISRIEAELSRIKMTLMLRKDLASF